MTANPTDKPLDCVGTAAPVGKHDFCSNRKWHRERIGEVHLEVHGPQGSLIRFEGPNAKANSKTFLLATVLLEKLGDTAIQAIMEGKAAVVPLDATTEQKRNVWGSDELPVFDWTRAKDFRKRMIAAARLDKPTSEDA